MSGKHEEVGRPNERRGLICDACDPGSDVEHFIQVSRFRIANLCCSGEERLIRVALENVKGVERIDVNIVGRYAVIRHCPHDCCANPLMMIDLLNKKRLGASIQEVSQHNDADEDDGVHLFAQIHAYLVTALFLVGLILQFSSEKYQMESNWVYIAGVIIGCVPILKASIIAVLRFNIDINILMLIALIGAVAVGEYFDGSLLVSLVLLAELVEGFILASVRKAIRQSSTSVPKQALLAKGEVKNVDDLVVGDIIAVRAGEMILGDGVVTKGEGVVDESAVTGEAMPLSKAIGQRALSGTVMQNGYLEISIDTTSEDSTLRKLRQAVQDVQADKGKYAALVDKFAQWWTPGVLFGAAAYVIIGGAISSHWGEYVERGLILLVLACPCAIVLAAPIPTSSAIARAAKNGVLIKGSSVIEAMSKVDVIAVDKTGTLTKGFFKVDEQIWLDDCFADEDNRDFNPLQLAAAVEAKSTHPLAHAVVAECLGCIDEADTAHAAASAARELKKSAGGKGGGGGGSGSVPEIDLLDPLPPVKQINIVPGVGVSGWVLVEDDWKFVMVGNERMLRAHGGSCTPSAEQMARITAATEACGGSRAILLTAVDDELCLLLALSDELREESSDAVSKMQNMSIAVHMLTGDQRVIAEDVCRRVGIPKSQCQSRLLPLQKQQWVQSQQTGFLDRATFLDLERNGSSSPVKRSKSITSEDGGKFVVDSQSVELLEPLVLDGENESNAAAGAGENITASSSSSLSLSAAKASSSSTSSNRGRNTSEDSEDGQHSPLPGKDGAPKYVPVNQNVYSNASDFAHREPRHTVCMIGDGVNDGAALAAADVGVAMGAGGSAIAVTAADCVLMTDNLMLLPYTFALCRQVRTIIIQNCVFSIFVKFIAICLALAGMLDIWQAVLIDMGSLIVVVVNGIRVLDGPLIPHNHTATTASSSSEATGGHGHSDGDCCGSGGGSEGGSDAHGHDHSHGHSHSHSRSFSASAPSSSSSSSSSSSHSHNHSHDHSHDHNHSTIGSMVGPAPVNISMTVVATTSPKPAASTKKKCSTGCCDGKPRASTANTGNTAGCVQKKEGFKTACCDNSSSSSSSKSSGEAAASTSTTTCGTSKSSCCSGHDHGHSHAHHGCNSSSGAADDSSCEAAAAGATAASTHDHDHGHHHAEHSEHKHCNN